MSPSVRPGKKVRESLTDPEVDRPIRIGRREDREIELMKRDRGVVSFGRGSVRTHFPGDVDILELDVPERQTELEAPSMDSTTSFK
jgi:hypothetical protein